MYYCFSCGSTGNAIHFLSAIDQISFNDALEKIAEINSFDIGKNEEWKKQKTHTEEHDNKARYFHSKLDKVTEYLKKRGLTDETITEFQLGYNDNISFRSGGKEKNTSGISIPLRDKNGRTIAFAYRTFGDIKYVNSSNSDFYIKGDYLFNADKAKKMIKDCLYICEGYFDVMSAYQQGLPCVAYAGSMLTKGHIQAIKELCNHKENVTLYLAPDNDDAGLSAVERMREKLKILNMAVRVVDIG